MPSPEVFYAVFIGFMLGLSSVLIFGFMKDVFQSFFESDFEKSFKKELKLENEAIENLESNGYIVYPYGVYLDHTNFEESDRQALKVLRRSMRYIITDRNGKLIGDGSDLRKPKLRLVVDNS